MQIRRGGGGGRGQGHRREQGAADVMRPLLVPRGSGPRHRTTDAPEGGTPASGVRGGGGMGRDRPRPPKGREALAWTRGHGPSTPRPCARPTSGAGIAATAKARATSLTPRRVWGGGGGAGPGMGVAVRAPAAQEVLCVLPLRRPQSCGAPPEIRRGTSGGHGMAPTAPKAGAPRLCVGASCPPRAAHPSRTNGGAVVADSATRTRDRAPAPETSFLPGAWRGQSGLVESCGGVWRAVEVWWGLCRGGGSATAGVCEGV